MAARTVTGGNEADGNPQGRWAMDSCQSGRARWVLTLPSAGGWRILDGRCAGLSVVNRVTDDL